MAERHFARRLLLLLTALLTMIVGSGIAFAAAEHTSVAYGLGWALDKVTTIGALPTPRTLGGRVILASLELFGIGTLFYGLATVAEFFVSGQLSGLLNQRRIQRMIDSYSDHFIVCGYGRVGRQVTHDLRAGADEVISPYTMAGAEMARLALNPALHS